jgi:hypothetical protein
VFQLFENKVLRKILGSPMDEGHESFMLLRPLSVVTEAKCRPDVGWEGLAVFKSGGRLLGSR